MITIRKRDERGPTNLGWLDSKHTFSFGYYQDPRHMGYGALRVINEDIVAPGAGFGTHPHSDMEIISYVLDGSLEHKDSMGKRSIIRSGDIQRISAGTGVTHSEYNASKSVPVHFLQIWFRPDEKGITPSYDQKSIIENDTKNRFKLVMSQNERDNSMKINQDVNFYIARLDGTEPLSYSSQSGRIQWIQIVRGVVDLNKKRVVAGDGVAVAEESDLVFDNTSGAEILLFDMADTRHL